jgi:hypothetical protein
VASEAAAAAQEQVHEQHLEPEQLKDQARHTSMEEAPEATEDLAERAGRVASETAEAAKEEAERQGLTSSGEQQSEPSHGESGSDQGESSR